MTHPYMEAGRWIALAPFALWAAYVVASTPLFGWSL